MSKGYTSLAGQRAFNENGRTWAQRDAGQRAGGAGVTQQAPPRPATAQTEAAPPADPPGHSAAPTLKDSKSPSTK